MFRRAEWKPRREDARGFWTLFALHPPVLAAALGFGALLALQGLDVLPLVGFIGGIGVLAPRRPRRSRSHGRALAEIAPWPPPPGVFPARILYYQGIDPVGDDEAVVAFGDGWITVEGLRAFFSLRPTDASILYVEANGCDLLLPGGERVEIRPYDAFEVGGESPGCLTEPVRTRPVPLGRRRPRTERRAGDLPADARRARLLDLANGLDGSGGRRPHLGKLASPDGYARCGLSRLRDPLRDRARRPRLRRGPATAPRTRPAAPAAGPALGYSSLSYSWAAFRQRERAGWKPIRTVPTGPLRCFAMMISASSTSFVVSYCGLCSSFFL